VAQLDRAEFGDQGRMFFRRGYLVSRRGYIRREFGRVLKCDTEILGRDP